LVVEAEAEVPDEEAAMVEAAVLEEAAAADEEEAVFATKALPPRSFQPVLSYMTANPNSSVDGL
jgi:hypothetical protein